MQGQLYSVRVYFSGEPKTYSPEFQTKPEFARAWKSVLKRAHGKARVTCLCPGKGDKQLAVRYMSDLDTFYLSRFPESGDEHDSSCRFYGVQTDIKTHSIDKKAVEKFPDGTLKIKLNIGLQERITTGQSDQTGPATSHESNKRTKKPATTLLRLLHLLWIRAGLNKWDIKDDERSFDLIVERLRRSARKIKAGFVDLSEVLCLAANRRDSFNSEVNRRIVNKCMQNNRRLIVIAPLAAYSEERGACRTGYLPIYGFHGIPFLKINKDLWDKTLERFSRAITAWEHGYRVVAIIQTEVPVNETETEVIDIALTIVSEAWIPIDSMVEGRVEEKLRAEGRNFYKPLIYSSKDIILPDFVLTDMGQNIPMEVFGMDEPDYEKHKQEKIEYYNQLYGKDGWWYWDTVADRNSIPDLPSSIAKQYDEKDEVYGGAGRAGF